MQTASSPSVWMTSSFSEPWVEGRRMRIWPHLSAKVHVMDARAKLDR